jgi:hypothetical protein
MLVLLRWRIVILQDKPMRCPFRLSATVISYIRNYCPHLEASISVSNTKTCLAVVTKGPTGREEYYANCVTEFWYLYPDALQSALQLYVREHKQLGTLALWNCHNELFRLDTSGIWNANQTETPYTRQECEAALENIGFKRLTSVDAMYEIMYVYRMFPKLLP